MPSPNYDQRAFASEFLKTVATFQARWSEAIGPLQDFWSKNGAQIAVAFRNLHENLANLPNDIQTVSKSLAERGWYIDHGFPVAHVRPILECFESGFEAKVDGHLSAYYRKALPDLEDRLVDAYPSRARALGQAFCALRCGQQYLAIPVLLAQADGICLDIFGGKLFQKKNGRPQVAERLDSLKLEDASGMFLSVLKLPGGICASEKFREEFPNCLNRHEILHGLDCTYGTELNGWKALSLVSFIGLLAPTMICDDDGREGASGELLSDLSSAHAATRTNFEPT